MYVEHGVYVEHVVYVEHTVYVEHGVYVEQGVYVASCEHVSRGAMLRNMVTNKKQKGVYYKRAPFASLRAENPFLCQDIIS